MHPTVKAARIAGALYVSTVPIAFFAWSYVPGKLIERGNATATAENMLAHETLFRLAILADLVGFVIFICLGFALYRLLRDVNRTWAVVMLGFVLVSGAVGFMNALNNIAALILFRGADFLTVLEKPQRDALAMLFLRLHGQGNVINEIFWGVWLFPFGLLVFRSGFLPRFLGVWLMINCFGWLAVCVTGLFFPPYSDAVYRYAQPVLFGEMIIMLWLLIRGANVAPVPAATSISNSGVQATQP
jgi:hypothetical protein